MKRLISILAFFLLTSAVFAQPTVFENVHVITMENEEILENHSVLIQGDRIAAVAPTGQLEIPQNASRIDGSGRYLMPGLAEMHGHIPPDNAPESYTENVLFLYVAAGITTVRGMLGAPNQLQLKEKINNGELIGPNLYLAGPSFSGGSIDSPEEAEQRVRKQYQEGWDLLKVHPGLTRAEFDAMAQTAREVGMRFGGHVPEEVGLVHALEMAQETLEHLDGYIAYLDAFEDPVTQSELEKAVALSLEHEVWVVPTMALWETIIGASDLEEQKQYDELKYMPSEMVEGWIESVEQRISSSEEERAAALQHAENRRLLLKALSDGGVPVLMGTDAPQLFSVPGFSIHRELTHMVEAGMSPYEILKSGTVNVGRYFSNEDDFGTVAEGRRADLILLNRNPLEDVSHISTHAGVMVRGEWLSRETIDERLQAIEASYQ